LDTGDNAGVYVECPLNDDFGFTVGSVFSTPFDTGGFNSNIAKAAALSNVGLNQLVAMKKVFNNPEPTEISFEVEFVAFYSAKHEVIVPVLRLLRMSLSRNLDVEQVESKFQTAVNAFVETERTVSAPLSSEDRQQVDRALSFIGFIAAPDKVNIHFGDLYMISDAYISSVAVKFSNQLDKDGIPMRATCNVTAIMERPPTINNIVDDWFGVVR
jgi:hypothetical protein